MVVTTGGHFLHQLAYDYVDQGVIPLQGAGKKHRFTEVPPPGRHPKIGSASTIQHYVDFLQVPGNYDRELFLYWNNLQDFLDEEQNLVNGLDAKQQVTACSIVFPDQRHPRVQWVVEFTFSNRRWSPRTSLLV
jgi:hypothetical protein